MTDIFRIAETNQARARAVIEGSGVVTAWEGIGAKINLVGSLATGLLMKHRDIDFHIYTDALRVDESFKAISRICSNPAVSQLIFRNLADTDEACFEWHAFYRDADGDEWQIDMIQILKGSRYDGYFERVAERILACLTPETKRAILELKYATPDDEHIMGIEYYQAVIAYGVRTWPEFVEWRRNHAHDGVIHWMP